MKTLFAACIFSALIPALGFAQTPPPNPNAANEPVAVATTPNDGFWLRQGVAVMTHGGVTTKLEKDIRLPNGMWVQKNGAVMLPSGKAVVLQENRLLTFEGELIQLPAAMAAEAGTTPTRPNVSDANQKAVGLSSHDGVNISGADVLITRNGVTEKLTSDVKFPNGVIAKPDGTVVLADGSKITLRSDQLLDLNGKLWEAPAQPNPPGPAPSSSSPN